MAVLVDKYLRYDFANPRNPMNDHLIFSKGHASPLLYSIFKAVGAVTDQELLTFRKFGSRLQGHPTPLIPWVDVATGSLGQGLPIAVGIALAGKYLDKLPYRVWVLLGDSEMAEGSVWEGLDHARYYHLGNLIGILDMNRLGQRGETDLGWNSAAYVERARAFGWRTIEVDGHNLEQIDRAYAEASQGTDQPTLIVAKTIKGRGVSFLENQENWHGKALNQQQAQQALAEIGGDGAVRIQVSPPDALPSGASPLAEAKPSGSLKLPTYDLGKAVATRTAYGDALKAVGAARPNLVVLDAEVSNSTYAEFFKEAYPDRFFEMFIAEQQMVAAAVGLSVRGYVPFASTFAAFLSRAYDFVRMAAISRANLRLCGSHAGVSIGEDGPSQMALEDLAMMRAVHGSTVLYPCDPNQTAQLVAALADQSGISFLRTTRGATPTIYSPDDRFTIGGSKTVRQSESDQVTIIAAGITLHEALKAHDELGKGGVAARVIDAYSVKPIDAAGLQAAARATRGRLIVVEDHWPEGGLGDAVQEAFTADAGWNADLGIKLVHLAVSGMPGSGTPQELLDAAGISSRHIVGAAKKLTA
jgi:transketolase